MANKLLDALEQGTNYTRTENGALTHRSSLDKVLDYFALAGAMRERPKDAAKHFVKAYGQDPLLAVKTMFYLRDVRGGQGERATFDAAFRDLLKRDRDLAVRLMPLIATYGYYKELIGLYDVEPTTVVTLVKNQLNADATALQDKKTGVSLLAKWLPSVKTSSAASRLLAAKLAADMGISARQYRLNVATLRKHIHLLEQDMSANRWDDIDYSKLPSQAFRTHTKAFKRHTPEKFAAFTAKVVKGEAKVNAGTLYPYQVYEKTWEDPEAAEAMWVSLPDYTNDSNALVMADVSGSMSGRPMAISVSLALYFAERNKGTFKGYYMTFTDQARLYKVDGGTLADKMAFIQGNDVGYNTNLENAFRSILAAATTASVPQEEMPKVLYIISDMEFDDQMDDCGETNFKTAQKLFKQAGYELPHVVFWNVNSRNDQTPATKYDKNVTLISGASASTFKYALQGKTPLESMMEVLTDKRYAPVEAAVKAAP